MSTYLALMVVTIARVYARVDLELFAICIRWSSIRFEFLGLWLSEFRVILCTCESPRGVSQIVLLEGS